MDDFESRLCAQLYIIKMFYMSQMNPKEFSTLLYILRSTTILCRSLPLNNPPICYFLMTKIFLSTQYCRPFHFINQIGDKIVDLLLFFNAHKI